MVMPNFAKKIVAPPPIPMPMHRFKAPLFSIKVPLFSFKVTMVIE